MSDPLLEKPPVHTLKSRLWDAYELSFHRLLRHAPIDMVSGIGGSIVRWSVPRNRPWIIEGARRNLRQLRPDLDQAQTDATVRSFLDNVGRLMGEFSVLHRLFGDGRIRFSDELLHAKDRVGERATLALILHTGNWEVIAAALHGYGIPCATFAVPPETWAQRIIATRVRRSLGMTIMPPDVRGLRQARKVLEGGGLAAIFPDEARHGRIMAPLFGRPPHKDGNLAIAAWLARRTGARLIVLSCRRTGNCRFTVSGTSYFDLPPESGGDENQALKDVEFLNGVVEPHVMRNLDQWYFLDDALT